MANSANRFSQMIINLWSGQLVRGITRYKTEDNSTTIGIRLKSHNVNNLVNYIIISCKFLF